MEKHEKKHDMSRCKDVDLQSVAVSGGDCLLPCQAAVNKIALRARLVLLTAPER